jgi:hypothetical protein
MSDDCEQVERAISRLIGRRLIEMRGVRYFMVGE